ncbi:hypothetical protein [Achromobacter dolens]|uniref:hypothetical protein n=1 Tax=Achromobacter dolens TaxID=1287738 RepID=UPI0013C29F0A|nr:hypothetical protein [Achromobacter dolens]
MAANPVANPQGSSAQQFFDKHAGNPKKVDALLGEQDRLAWENERCAANSPGVVAATEVLCRQIVNPVHVEKATGLPKPTAYDDIMNKGLSVERLDHATREAIIERGVARANDYNVKNPEPEKKRSLVALSMLKVEDIRAHEFSGARTLAVYDTALPDIPAHADVCMVVERTEFAKKSARSHLFEIATNEPLNIGAGPNG